MKTSNQMRVLLDKDAYQAVGVMMEELKAEGDYIKINPSRLVSWIICKFHEEGFKKSIPQISQDHFNSKEYLKNLAQNLTDSDDLETVLKETLQKIKPSKAKIAQKTNRKESQEDAR